MQIRFIRKKGVGLFFANVPVSIGGEVIARIGNGGTFDYNGPAKTITLQGPGVVRSVTFDLEVDFEDITIEFKIAMGLLAGGFTVKILHGGEVVQKLRKTY